MGLLDLYLSRVVAAAALPLVVAHAHISKVFVWPVSDDLPIQRMALWAFVVQGGSCIQCCFQHFHSFAQGIYFVWCGSDAFPRRPFAQHSQNRIECAHV